MSWDASSMTIKTSTMITKRRPWISNYNAIKLVTTNQETWLPEHMSSHHVIVWWDITMSQSLKHKLTRYDIQKHVTYIIFAAEHLQVTPRLTKLSLNSTSAWTNTYTHTHLSLSAQHIPYQYHTHSDFIQDDKTGTSSKLVSHNAEVPLKMIKTGPMVVRGKN